jgi:hypothetical protein
MFMRECGVEREIDEREMNTTYSELEGYPGQDFSFPLHQTSPN